VLSPRVEAFYAKLRATPNFGSEEELRAFGERHGDSPDLVQAVIDAKIVGKDDACRFWADGMNVAYVDPFVSVITDEAIEKIPLEVAKKVRAIGLYIFNGTMTVAMAAPDEAETAKRLGQIARIPVSPVFALPREVDDAIAIHYSNEERLEDSLGQLERSNLFDQPELAGDKLAHLAENNALVQILDEIVYYAMRERATDIHIEAQEIHSRIRFRVDGNLREILTYSRKLHRALISRIKILCNLDIAESRLPQDGRFSLPIGNQTANFRVSTIPSAYGEKVVIRILAMSGKKSMITLEKMMMSQTILQPFKRLVQNPNGIIFVTGPTGSGKTTTLYSALHEINSPELNISTIEDPIEIQLEGVTQSQVNATIDLKFANLLRALMRQDPDAILIGEIRDLETAKIATEAALTGHIVFATLHTNSAPQAITRLIEIGVEPYMVAPSVIGVLAQRLAARICENCKEAYTPSREVLAKYFKDEGLTDVTFYRGRGCPKCRGTGYKGRVAIHELVLITEEIRALISEERSVQEITKAAAKVGYRPLRYDGLKKVLLGLTTISEIEANTSFEWAT
jgi:type II secretory ATPase GspE/PulE/Tfp pilus assembly ATPase PilB-like protein